MRGERLAFHGEHQSTEFHLSNVYIECFFVRAMNVYITFSSYNLCVCFVFPFGTCLSR